MNNNKGTFNLMDLPVNLLVLFITVTFLVALIPGFTAMINMGQDSQGLNCAGYNNTLDPTLSYNASIGTKSTIGCLAMQLYIPYIVLGVLVAAVSLVFYGRSQQQQQQF